MSSRMDRYDNNTPQLKSRTTRNKELYTTYDSSAFDKFDLNNNVEVLKNNARSIDVDQIRDMLDKKYREDLPKRKSISVENFEEPVTKKLQDTKEYDINSILSKAKDELQVDYENDRLKHSYSASLLVDEVKKKYPQKDDVEAERELQNLINTITELEMKNRDKNAELLDLADDDEELPEVKEEVKSNSLVDDEETFYTGQLAVSEDDFEDFEDMKNDIKSNNILVKVLIFIFVLVALGIAIVFANKYFNLGLF